MTTRYFGQRIKRKEAVPRLRGDARSQPPDLLHPNRCQMFEWVVGCLNEEEHFSQVRGNSMIISDESVLN